MSMADYARVCDDYDVELLDPKQIFTFQLEDDERPLSMYHFIAHMETMRNTLPDDR